MRYYKFDKFRFYPDKLQCFYQQKPINIRPKAALLLNYLLKNKGCFLTKKEIFDEIWPQQHVQDHLLFQVISEIRKLAPEQELIQTVSGKGYRWVAQTSEVKHSPKYFLKYFMPAISAAALLLTVGVFYFLTGVEASPQLKNMPGIRALSKGAIALEAGNYQQAADWFRFSLKENPQSSESALLLAETLFEQHKFEESVTYAERVLNHPGQSEYTRMVALELLSRIYQEKGQLNKALNSVLKGNRLLDHPQPECTRQIIVDRIKVIKELMNEKDDVMAQAQQQWVQTNQPASNNSDYEKYCTQLKPEVMEDQLGHCDEISTQGYYVQTKNAALAVVEIS